MSYKDDVRENSKLALEILKTIAVSFRGAMPAIDVLLQGFDQLIADARSKQDEPLPDGDMITLDDFATMLSLRNHLLKIREVSESLSAFAGP